VTNNGGDQTDGWTGVGRSLLSARADILGGEVHSALRRISKKARNGEEIAGDDVQNLNKLIRELEFFHDEAAKVPDDYERTIRLTELDWEDLQEYAESRGDMTKEDLSEE